MKSRQKINHWLVLILVAAAVWRWAAPVPPPGVGLENLLPGAASFRQISTVPPMWAGENNGKIQGYVVLAKAGGYGGPMVVSTSVDPRGKILDVTLVDHKDTSAFIRMLENQYFMERFKGIDLSRMGSTLAVDGISGATYSSIGVKKGVQAAGRAVMSTLFNRPLPPEEKTLQWGHKEMAVLVLMALAVWGIWARKWKLRWVTLMGGLIFLGFFHNMPLSISSLVALILGFCPDIFQSPAWYLMVPGILIFTLVLGKNHYCYWLCPFGAFQELTSRIGNGKWKCKKNLDAALSKIKYGVTFVVVLAGIVLSNPGAFGYEPFAALFALQGAGLQWYILPLVVFASFFIHRFWCRYFCPVGVVLGVAARYGVQIRKKCTVSKKNGIGIMGKTGK